MTSCSNQERSFDDLCDGITNYYECLKVIEEHQIRKYSDYVNRNDKSLILKLTDGKNLELIDKNDEPNTTELFTFRRYFDNLKLFEIVVHGYEGSEFLLVNGLNGNQYSIWGEIKFCPDSTRFISWINSIDGPGNNGFQIFKKTNDDFTKEFELNPNQWGPENPIWIDNKTIEFEQYGYNDGDYHIYSKTTFVFQNDNWKENN